MSPIEKLKNVIETIYSNDETFSDLSDVELASCKEAVFTIADAEDLIEQMKQANLVKLRDEFAGKAMQGYLAGRNLSTCGSDTYRPENVAKTCYGIADEMLKARAL